MKAQIRKIIVQVDEVHIEMGQTVSPPTRRALAMAVIHNPLAGGYTENLDELIAIGEELGGLLGDKCIKALGIAPGSAQSYGKAAIVGEGGEIEHAAAILHPKLGAPLRAAVEKGAALDVPMTHINASYVRSHFDAIEVRVPGAPLADEIVFILAMSTGARIHARVGGLAASAISKWDGLR